MKLQAKFEIVQPPLHILEIAQEPTLIISTRGLSSIYTE